MSQPFPPTNNGERYAAAILEALRLLIAATERTTAEIAKLNAYVKAANAEAPNPEQLSFSIGVQRADPEDVISLPGEAPAKVEHVLVSRLRCSCGFSVNPKTYAALKAHIAEFAGGEK